MNVETGAEAALCPEKEYINGIAVAVYEGEGGVVRGSHPMSKAVHTSPNKLWKSNSIFKGTVSRDFLRLVFFLNQFPPSL